MKTRTNAGMLLFMLAVILFMQPLCVLATDYSDYFNEAVAFGLKLRDDHKKPKCEKPSGVKLSDYDTYYYDIQAYKNNDKVIYLTFDCGYENGHTPAILDALKAADVKAIFFVTQPYVRQNAKLVKRMKEEGHLVGNHTTTHPRLTELTVSDIKDEINQCAKTMKKRTGYSMDPYIRPPEGVYSVRVMKVLQDMGYNTMLWSLAIYDYEEDDQPGADYVLQKFEKHHFCGMMPLLHVISSSDTEALPDVIYSMKDEGYRFGEVTEFTDTKEEKKEGQDPEKDQQKQVNDSDDKNKKEDKKENSGEGKNKEEEKSKEEELGEKAGASQAGKEERKSFNNIEITMVIH